jgi:hypothetical protein
MTKLTLHPNESPLTGLCKTLQEVTERERKNYKAATIRLRLKIAHCIA